jgi:hypothetical protein
VTIALFTRMVQVARSSTTGTPRLDKETFKALIDLENVMCVSSLGNHHVAGLDVMLNPFGKDFCLALGDQPQFVVVVVMTVKTAAI